MKTAKIFANGQSQAVRLPKEYRFDDTEVGIMKVGEVVLLYPRGKEEKLFMSSLGNFTDDFFEGIESSKNDSFPESTREKL